MRKYLTILFFFVFVLNNYAQVNCNKFNNDDYYFVTKSITKRKFKKEKLSNEEKNLLKKELVEQISTKISVVSSQNSSNIVNGDLGLFSSTSKREVSISSLGSINNPEFIFCTSGNLLFVYCIVRKSDFDNDLYNNLVSKETIFRSKINQLNNNNISNNIFLSLKELKNEYYYLLNGIDIIASSDFISDEKRIILNNRISSTLALYNKLENSIGSNFDDKILELNNKLRKNEYFEIKNILSLWTSENFSIDQQQKINQYKILYENELNSYINNLKQEIEKSIRNRNKNLDDLFFKYSKITFYKDNLSQLNKYKKKFQIANGYARNNLFFGLNVGSTFQELDRNNGNTTDLNRIETQFNFNQVLPSYCIGLKHYFFNPRKRFGLSVVYKNFSNSLIKLGETEVENSIKDFSVFQAGFLLGPLEVYFGETKSNLIIEDLNLISVKFTLIRTDKLSNKFSKSNYLDFSLSGDYLSDFKENSYVQIGLCINYAFVFNRTPKY